jgi:ribosomal-protein-alanine N-acetyltransferase
VKPIEIETDRLRLRPLRADDLDEVHGLWVDPDVRKYLWDDEAIPRERAASVIRVSKDLFEADGYGLWAVSRRDEKGVIGFSGFWYFREPPELELLYGLAPAHWGRGLATEAAKAIIRYGFEELSMSRIAASTDAANRSSVGVMQRAGMSFDKRASTGGLDTIYYVISREGYEPDGSHYRIRHAD